VREVLLASSHDTWDRDLPQTSPTNRHAKLNVNISFRKLTFLKHYLPERIIKMLLFRYNALILYSGCARFESWPEHWLLRPYVRCFPQSLQENSGIITRLGQDGFLPSSFQFIIHLPSYHLMLRVLDTEIVPLNNPPKNLFHKLQLKIIPAKTQTNIFNITLILPLS
jgi:hypothetical protein